MTDGTYPVFAQERETGFVTVEKRGLFTRLKLRAALTSRVSRLMCHTGNGWISLGIPIPKDGQLLLEKNLSHNDIAALDIDSADAFCLIPSDGKPPQNPPVTSAPAAAALQADEASNADKSHPVPNGWQAVTSASSIHKSFPDIAAVVYSMGDKCLVAFPFEVGSPFPAPALFRYARVENINGRSYAVFGLKGRK